FLLHLAEDGWREEISLAVRALGQRDAALQERRAFFLRDLGVARRGLDLLLVDLRPHLDVLFEAVADAQLLCPFDDPRSEFTGNTLVHDHAAGRGTALAAGAE